ncbi:MAG: SH3 domain-containing protein [Salinispira sp.]
MPETQVLYAANSWGVTILPYLPIYNSDSIEAQVLQLLRRGDIVEVLEQRPDAEFMYGDRNHWYRILHNSSEAWSFGAGFRFFPTEDQAHDAARRLLHGENF